MRLVEMNWNPTQRQLRQFGLISLVVLPALGWLWGHGNLLVVEITAAVGLGMAVLGWLYAPSLRPIFVGLMLLAIPIGMVLSEVALALVFFGLLVPLGLFFRLVGRDALHLKFDRQATTYWQPKKRPTDAASYFRQW